MESVVKVSVISSSQLNLPACYRIQLNPKMMSSLRLGAGDPVWLVHDGVERGIASAWPSIATDNNRCGLTQDVLDAFSIEHTQDLSIALKAVSDPLPECSCVTLIPLAQHDNEKNRQMMEQFVRDQLTKLKYICAGQLVKINFMAQPISFKAVQPKPNEFTGCHSYPRTYLRDQNGIIEGDEEPLEQKDTFAFVCTQNSEVKFKYSSMPKQNPQPSADSIDFSSVGGLKKQIEVVRETVETPLLHPEIYQQFGLAPPKGILLYGPPGTGKTLIARVVAAQTKAYFSVINGAELMSKYVGETESRLREIFNDALENAPSILFIDEMDSLCPKREESSSETEKRIVATLLTLMDGISTKSSNKNIVVLGATNRPNAIDSALRRPGRFDKEIEIPVPNADERFEILKIHLKNIPHSFSEDELKVLASGTHGYVGADLAALVREAGMLAIKRWQHHSDTLETQVEKLSLVDGNSDKSALQIHFNDLIDAKAIVGPSAMREITLQIPTTHWSDIGGMDEQKQCLQESIIFPLKYPGTFKRMGIQPPKGVLLYGPPGCSKTLLAKALATESEHNFFLIKGSEVFNPYVGESERILREIFRKARQNAPSIIFFDEIDALAGSRSSDNAGGAKVGDRILTTLLNEMDGMENLEHVFIVGATNRPDILDPALMRPGRLDRLVYVAPPDAKARKAILELQCRGHINEDVDIDELVIETEGWTGAEVVGLCREAAMRAIRADPENASQLSQSHFEEALKTTTTRLTPGMIAYYERFAEKMK